VSNFAVQGGLFAGGGLTPRGLFGLPSPQQQNNSQLAQLLNPASSDDAALYRPFSAAANGLFGRNLSTPQGLPLLQQQAKQRKATENDPLSPTAQPAKQISDDTTAEEGAQIFSNYVNFLQGLHLDQPQELTADTVSDHANQLIHAVTDPLGIDQDDIRSLHIESQFSLAQVYASGQQQGADGSQSSAVIAGAAAQAHLTADITTKDGRTFHIDASLQASAGFASFESQSPASNAVTAGNDGANSNPAVGGDYSLAALFAQAQTSFQLLSSTQTPAQHGPQHRHGRKHGERDHGHSRQDDGANPAQATPVLAGEDTQTQQYQLLGLSAQEFRYSFQAVVR
jgi:hypothetical protein